MGRVFITQQPRPNARGWTPNFNPATQYGSLHFVFSGSDHPYCNPDQAIEDAAHVLSDFDPDNDYVLYPNTGDPAAIYTVLIVLARMPIDKIRFLYWERKMVDGVRSSTDGFYSPITFKLPL